MKTALITGALGQDGSYMTEHLVKMGYKVFGLIRKTPWLVAWAGTGLVTWSNDMLRTGQVEYIYGDMRDEVSLRTAFQKAWPDEVYNYAGQVFVPTSWKIPEQTLDVNVGGLTRILRIVEDTKSDTKVYQASSSEMFGNHEGACTVSTPMNPQSPYGVSKYAAHKLVKLYREKGLYVVAGILFNHESPRRGEEMVTRKISKAVASWSVGAQAKLSLGNLDSKRDWGFAGEYVEAMHLMLQQPEARDYVVGTGKSHSVKEFVEEAALAAGLTWEEVEKKIEIDERFKRVQEIHDMRADITEFATLTGWRPRISFRELVRMMVRAEQLRFKDLKKGEFVPA